MLKTEAIYNKVFTSEHLQQQIAVWKFKEKKIVFTNGCFDFLHLGHISYLLKAAELGDVLIIGLNSDSSVQRLKGKGRPVNNENARALIMASLAFVNAVILFDEDTPYELIRNIQPDILVKGKDYKTEEIAGHDIVLGSGGQVITIELLPGYSTTGMIEKLRAY